MKWFYCLMETHPSQHIFTHIRWNSSLSRDIFMLHITLLLLFARKTAVLNCGFSCCLFLYNIKDRQRQLNLSNNLLDPTQYHSKCSKQNQSRYHILCKSNNQLHTPRPKSGTHAGGKKHNFSPNFYFQTYFHIWNCVTRLM